MKAERTRPDLLVLGVGNLLLGDDGAGLALLELLRPELEADGTIEVVDGGTQGLALLGLLDGRRGLLLLDAVSYGAEPGTVSVSRDPLSLVRPGAPGPRNAHDGNAVELLAAAWCLGTLPRATWLLGIEPARLDTHIGLSPRVQAALPRALREARRLVRALKAEAPGSGAKEEPACTS